MLQFTHTPGQRESTSRLAAAAASLRCFSIASLSYVCERLVECVLLGLVECVLLALVECMLLALVECVLLGKSVRVWFSVC
jgi:hypothetical protein